MNEAGDTYDKVFSWALRRGWVYYMVVCSVWAYLECTGVV